MICPTCDYFQFFMNNVEYELPQRRSDLLDKPSSQQVSSVLRKDAVDDTLDFDVKDLSVLKTVYYI